MHEHTHTNVCMMVYVERYIRQHLFCFFLLIPFCKNDCSICESRYHHIYVYLCMCISRSLYLSTPVQGGEHK